jgi:hypothetical protein
MTTLSEGREMTTNHIASFTEEISEEIESRGIDVGVLCAWMDNFHLDYEDVGVDELIRFETDYIGTYESVADFAKARADSFGFQEPYDWPYKHIDWTGAANALFNDGDFWRTATDHEVFVFYNS